ncbi:MAG: DegT/DnrJ/EryC1/StrS family aminotransferase [Dehalococcoidia bacterium]
MTVPFVDLRPAHDEIRAELDAAWRDVTASNGYIGGPTVEAFEARWAAYCGRQHCVGVGNGTDAIEIALAAAGIGPGDEVIVPANTFIATVEAVITAGATPVLVDVDDETLLITADHIAAAITPRTAAVIVVHLFGQVVPMDAILELARERGIMVIEDAAQAHGARWRGRIAGSFGHVATFSFYPGKNLGAFGDGGALVTDDAALATRAREIGNHGTAATNRYQHHVLGRNSRLDALQAAVLSAKVDRLDAWNASRRVAAAQYDEALRGHASARPVGIAPETESAHHLYVVRVPGRARVREELDRLGIGTGIHYPTPCHLHPPYLEYAREALPVAEQASMEIVSLPMFAYITEAQVAEASAGLLQALESVRAASEDEAARLVTGRSL